MSENENGAGRGPAQAWTFDPPAVEPTLIPVEVVRLRLSDLGRALHDGDVRLTPAGYFTAWCPVGVGRGGTDETRFHRCVITLTDDGTWAVLCATCQHHGALPRLVEALRARFPHAEPTHGAPQPELLQPWVRQAAGAPALALRQVCAHRLEALTTEPEEVARWLRG